ncbi:hypothetical protein BGZ81_001151 [Podila clonocystis]|nr:hypothetical protein BGZ81_001151 [Podila clonocystis]
MLVKRTFVVLVSFLVTSSVSANKKRCEKACTKEYDPICARSKTGDLKEFGNTCTFEIAVCSEPYLRWEAVNKGPCEDPKKCEKACTTEYDPICARSKSGELKEFGNACTFEIAVCSEPYLRWQEANKGPCEDPKKKCEKACTKEYNPVCARSKTGELKEFGNPCTFEIALCSEPYLRWQVANKGPCEDPKKKCEKACTTEYDPICARSKNGELKEFGNACTFEIAVCSEPYLRWQEANKGPCEDPKKKCEKACTKEYNPVCARSKTGELKEFGNPCTFEVAVCSEPYLRWQEVDKGLCKCERNAETPN